VRIAALVALMLSASATAQTNGVWPSTPLPEPEQAPADEGPRRPAQLTPEQEREVKARKEKAANLKLDLPIGYFVASAVLGGLGWATGHFSAGPEIDLRNPNRRESREETLRLYRRAYYGGLVSRGLYAASASVGGVAAFKTQSAVRSYLTEKAQLNAPLAEATEPAPAAQVRGGFALVPGGAGFSLEVAF
jgi:hypothetical protein